MGVYWMVLAALGVLFGAYNWGEETERQRFCEDVYQAYFNMPVDEGGCGGDLNSCPVEAPDWYTEIMRENCWGGGDPLPQ